MVYCVGITGAIASGKTTVTNLFSNLGVDVIHADAIAKELTKIDLPAYKTIVAHFGAHILNNDHEINRTILRTIIFSNKEERIWLEKLLHPLIRKELKKRVRACTKPYCIVEIPLLTTKKTYPYINSILLISAPIESQISRLQLRDKCSREQALAILSSQPHISLRINHADDIIYNDMELSDLKILVNKLHHQYLNKSVQ